jgi:hypothetical protein
MLSDVILSVIMLSVAILSVIILSVALLCVAILSVAILSVVMLIVVTPCYKPNHLKATIQSEFFKNIGFCEKMQGYGKQVRWLVL